MAGGLIQIATYGSQDLFLTGVPEITFFKVVYRRHTNFSMESISVPFDDPVSFGNYSVVKLPKVGDLIHKTYVEIHLPAVNLLRQTIPQDPIPDLKESVMMASENYQIVFNYMRINRAAFAAAYVPYVAENNSESAVTDMINAINDVFDLNDETVQAAIESMRTLLDNDQNAPFTYPEIAMNIIAGQFSLSDNKIDLFNALTVGIEKSIKTQQYYYNNLQQATKDLEEATNPNIKFAWVERLGHAIIESVEVKIGGQKVDKHYGDWLNIWYELSGKRDMESVYYNMIGNVPTLTEFNRSPKPSYLLKIPLQFWFCKFSGLSIPMVSLQYHDVTLHIKFRSFQEVSYIESGTNIKYSLAPTGITLQEVPEDMSININANLLIDYIYLDNHERRRFAQSSHEYLIEEIQLYEQTNVTQQTMHLLINNFVHPSKELIWVAQKTSYTMNVDGTNQCRWNNYSLTDANEGNPVAYTTIDFNSYNRVFRLDGNYFNYVQPYENHWTTPSDGINVYSFSIFPEELQPSGYANLSAISRIVMTMEFDAQFFNNGIIKDPLIIRIYTRNINILRFVNGFSGLMWTYG